MQPLSNHYSSDLEPPETSTLRLGGICSETGHIALFERYLQKRSLQAGEILFHQGETPDSLYFIAAGRLNVLLELPQERDRHLCSLGPGTVVGEMGVYSQSPRSATVVADSPSCLYQLTQAKLNQMERDAPSLANTLHKFIVRALSDRLNHFKQETSMLPVQPRVIHHPSDDGLPGAVAESLSNFVSLSGFPDYDESQDSSISGIS